MNVSNRPDRVTETLAAVLAAVAVFAGIVAPPAILVVALGIIGLGLIGRLRDVRIQTAREVQNPR